MHSNLDFVDRELAIKCQANIANNYYFTLLLLFCSSEQFLIVQLSIMCNSEPALSESEISIELNFNLSVTFNMVSVKYH